MKPENLNQYFGSTDLYSDLDSAKITEILSKAVTFPTVSYEDVSKMDGDSFKGLHAFFQEAFPLVHKAMEKTIINDWSLLFHLKGSDSSLKPALFMAHIDVVPIVPGTEKDWTYPPFSGHMEDGYIWGRGSIDTKSMVVGELAAAEYLLGKGLLPKRDLYLAFGHDEETMGVDGSLAIKEYLENKGVTLEFVMDEGGGFKMGSDFGAPDSLIAKIDIFEKGYADIAIEADSKGGHSSRPGKHTSLGKVARAVGAIESNQFKPELNPVVSNMFKELQPVITEEPFKTYANNLDNAENNAAFAEYLCSIDILAPMVHTTTAVTMLEGGSPSPNVLPQKVRGVINFRISAEDTCQSVLQHCIDTVNDSELNIYMTKGLNPSKISKIDSLGYNAMKEAVDKFFPSATLVPSLVTGGTDCRYFEDICDCCYRFRPYIDNMVLGHTTHSTNERCYTEGLIQGIKLITHVMKTTCF